jgi:uncharacterized membrane protein (UPF0127 family)
MKNRQSIIAYILLGVFLLGGAAYYLVPLITTSKVEPINLNVPAEAPNFVKEGEVTFLKNGKVHLKIDVEIAENENERAKGLMYRSSIPDSVGMLFIFDRPEPQSFWMHNTSIPLDIIYVDANKKIISIAANTEPYSDEAVPSLGDAQYVVEVNAGFSERNNIKTGDAISF